MILPSVFVISVYDWEMTPSHGAQNFTNLAFGTDLEALGYAYGNHSIVGLWDFNGECIWPDLLRFCATF